MNPAIRCAGFRGPWNWCCTSSTAVAVISAGERRRKSGDSRFHRVVFHFFKVYRSGVDADGRSGFHAGRLNAQTFDGTGQERAGRFGASAALNLFASDVHQSVEEGAGRDDYAAGVELCAPYGAYAGYMALLGEQLGHLVLPDVQVGGVFQNLAPFLDEAHAVALGARAPHGRSFGAVEHAELDGGAVGDQARESAQRIDFANNLALGNAADGGVAAHLGNFVHIHRDEAGFAPMPAAAAAASQPA